MKKILRALNIDKYNAGASDGTQWLPIRDKTYTLVSYNPTTEEPIAAIAPGTMQDYNHLVQHAERAFLSWRTVPAPKRGDIIRKISNQLRAKKYDLSHLISLETGKTTAESDGEVQEMIDMADFAVGLSRMLYGNTMPSERPNHRLYEQWHPLGVVGIITAFNFPVAVWAWNAFIAVICGNTVIWKPSSKTPLCAIAIQHICNTAMADDGLTGIFSMCATQDRQVANQFTLDTRLPLISFTGSSETGKKVAENVAKRMGKSILECSGNNAIIVDKRADLDLAIPAITFSAIATSGQRCTSARRLFVHESIVDHVAESLVAAYEKITIGDPLDTDMLMGPLIDQRAVHAFTQTIDAARKAGGEILFGGHALQRRGYFVEPTLMTAEPNWPLLQQETFAPILYVMSVPSLKEAIYHQNNVPQGLSSALFTRNLQHAEQFLSSQGSDCGIANVNIGTAGAEIGGAFGGEKSTGGGREAGSDAWKSYMRRQTVTINWGGTLPLAQGIEFDLDLGHPDNQND